MRRAALDDDEVLDPELLALLRPSQPPASRPVSVDPEETLRQLEQLAASLKRFGGAPDGAGRASEEDDGARHNLDAEDAARDAARSDLSHAENADPAETKDGAEPAWKDSAVMAVPYIVVTSSDELSRQQSLRAEVSGSSFSDEFGGIGMNAKALDSTEDLEWVDAYGGWGTSEKGKWKEIVEVDDDDEEQVSIHVPVGKDQVLTILET